MWQSSMGLMLPQLAFENFAAAHREPQLLKERRLATGGQS